MPFNVKPDSTYRGICDVGQAALALGYYAQKLGPSWGASTSVAAMAELNTLANALLDDLKEIEASTPTTLAAIGYSRPLTKVSNSASLHNNSATLAVAERMAK